MDAPKPTGGGTFAKLKRNPKALAAIGVLLLVAFLYLRSRSSSSTTTSSTTSGVDPNAIDPATGLTYGEEQQAALDAQSSGSSSGSLGTSPATTDQITTPSGESLSSALTDVTTGLSNLQTQQANDEALLQSASEAAAQANEQLASLTSLGSPGPQSTGTGAGSPAVGSVTGGSVTISQDTISGGTVYEAPVTDTTTTTNNYVAPAPTPPPAPKSSPTPPPKATPPPPAKTVKNAYNSPATSTHLH